MAVHAESEEITARLTRGIRDAGGSDVRAFLDSRPVIAEVEAIQRAALLAREAGAWLHIVHISSGRGVAAALEARARGTDITIETCAHYLFFTEDDLVRLGAVAKCAPPLRSAANASPVAARARWRSRYDCFGPFPEFPDLKSGDDFFAIWGGIAGVQSRLAVLLESGHHSGDSRSGHRDSPRYPGPPLRSAERARSRRDTTPISPWWTLRASTLRNEELRSGTRSPLRRLQFRGIVRRTLLRGQTIFPRRHDRRRPAGQFVRPTSGDLCIVSDSPVAHSADHRCLTPDTFVRAPLPGMTGATAIVHAAPALGAAFTQYTAEFEPGGSLGPATTSAFSTCSRRHRRQDGRRKHHLPVGDYAYLPSGLRRPRCVRQAAPR